MKSQMAEKDRNTPDLGLAFIIFREMFPWKFLSMDR